jgi:DNA-binding transcriptional MerR regulator/methylmalonyl-CoA mutase cobalamin-binding subunit
MVRETYRDPIYNLKAVVAETGITADALRAWQRRYGLPQPARTKAGHRVYSRRDIDIIRWLVAHQKDGLRIGRAVKLWRSLEKEGYDPLQKMPPPVDETGLPMGGRITELSDDWVSASLTFDEPRAERVLAQAFAIYSPELVVSRIIREGIVQIGQLWYEGDATPQQEHFASQIAVRHIESMIRAMPLPVRRGRILIACPPKEEHTLGPLMLNLLLRRAGWEVLYLGANVPIAQLGPAIASTSPYLVILAAQQLHTAANLLDMAHAIQQDGVSVAYGGGIFNREPALRERIPGHFLGSTLEEAVQETENLMVLGHETPSFERPSQAYQQVISCCFDQLLSLEANVWTALEPMRFDESTLRELNSEFVLAVVAALRLGDIGLVGDYLNWMEDRAGHTRVPADILSRYLKAYRQAAEESLGERGALIINWLHERLRGDTKPGESG